MSTRRNKIVAPLQGLEHAFSTQHVQAVMKKTGLGAELAVKPELCTAKALRRYFDLTWKQRGWTPAERRSWKRAAVLVLRQLPGFGLPRPAQPPFIA